MTTYYINANTGSNSNDGKSPTSAWATLQKTTGIIAAGDTILVMNGTYSNSIDTDHVLTIVAVGTQANPIAFKAYPGHSPKIVVGNNFGGILAKSNYLTIEGFEIEGGAKAISYDYALAHKLDNLPELISPGIQIDGLSGTEFHHITIRKNYVHHMSAGGIDVDGCDYITIEQNICAFNAWWSRFEESGISVYEARHADASTATKITVRRNLCYGNQNFISNLAGDITDGSGIIIDDNRNTQTTSTIYIGKTLVENNICHNNGGAGVMTFSSDNVTVRNNTCYRNCNGNRPTIWGELVLNETTDCTLANNAAYARGGQPAQLIKTSTGQNARSNLYFNGSVTTMGTGDVVGDPQFYKPPVGPSLEAVSTGTFNASEFVTADFRPRQASPACDNGDASFASSEDFDGKPRDSSPFKGAYESFVSSAGGGKTDSSDMIGPPVSWRKKTRKKPPSSKRFVTKPEPKPTPWWRSGNSS